MPDKKPPFTAGELVLMLRQSDSIPALDENVAQLCRMAGNRDTAATDLTLIIMRDAAITSRLLALANSAIYRARTPVKTVSAAVILLGFERVLQLALGLSLFNKHAANIRDKELYRLLVCAYCTGNLAMHLARTMGDERPEELFVSGLLCQLPRLILANGFPDLYRQMDQLVVSGKCDVNLACKQVFGVRFEEIAQAIADHWNLGETAAIAASSAAKSGADARRRAVHLAVNVSDLLFGNRAAGPDVVGATTLEITSLLRVQRLSLPDFVGASAAGDPNMYHFFNLNEQDLVMMTRIAEWGKVSSSEVANSLTANFKKRPESAPALDEPLEMAHFLSELMVSVRKRYAFSDVLMIAQEGIYRCIHPDGVIAAFLDRDRKLLRGRLYAGARTGVAAQRYRVTLDGPGLAAQNMRTTDAVIAQVSAQPVLDDDRLLADLEIVSVLLVPIVAGAGAIGQLLLGRRANQPPFTPDDCLWMTAIAGHLGMSFEQLDE
jgi:HD-like signal output (HDOD) protein